MITYKSIETKNGKIMYYVNGKLKSPAEIPDGIKLRLGPGDELTMDGVQDKPEEPVDILAGFLDEQIEEAKVEVKEEELIPLREENCPNVILDTRKCIFNPDEKAEHIKFVSLQNVGLCDDHWRTMSTGKVVAQLRKVTL